MKDVDKALLALCLMACSTNASGGSSEPPRAPQDAERTSAGAGATSDASMATEPADAHDTPGVAADAGGSAPDSAAEAGDATATVRAPVDAAAMGGAGGAGPLLDGGPSTDDGTRIVFPEPTFFSLPINSVRHGVSGHDPESDLCISVIWFLRSFDEARFCDGAPFPPYVWIEPATPAGCWGYSGNAEVLAVRGCVDFADLTAPADDSSQLEVDVHSDVWSGTVRFGS